MSSEGHLSAAGSPVEPPDVRDVSDQRDLFDLAAVVTGSESDAVRFMTTPALGLNGEVPLQLARTVEGHQTVRELLLRILHGVYN